MVNCIARRSTLNKCPLIPRRCDWAGRARRPLRAAEPSPARGGPRTRAAASSMRAEPALDAGPEPHRRKQLVWPVAGGCACLVLLCSVFCVTAAAQPANSSPSPSQLSVQLNQPQPGPAPVAVPEPSARAISHYRSGMMLLGLFLLWNLLLPTLLLFTGLSARMRSWAERWGRKWYFTCALYWVAYGLAYFLLSLPLNYYAGFVHPHSYDLSNQTLGKWLSCSLFWDTRWAIMCSATCLN